MPDAIINSINGTSDASGIYPVGQTTITWTATDIYGNTGFCTTVVTVTDDEAPVIVCQADIAITAEPGVCGAHVTYELPEFTDNCAGTEIALIAGLESGEFFPVGMTTVTYEATDAAGNTAQCSFTVTVSDDEAPAIVCVENISVANDLGVCGAVVSYDFPIATDNCEVASVELTAGLPSGSVFPVGVTTVEYTATDLAGNTTSCSFTVEVLDEEAPIIVNCTPNVVQANDAGECGAIVSYALAEVTDNCEVVEVSLVEGFESGEFFPAGMTTVTYSYTDAAGNTSLCSFTVEVLDEEAPVIECIEVFEVGTDYGVCGANVNFPLPAAFDNCPGVTVEVTGAMQPGDFFETGETVVSFTATDASGNTAECSYTVIVIDVEAPVIECPEDIVQVDPLVEFEDPIFSDNCWAGLTMTEGLPSGSEFPHGYTTVTFEAEDLAGNITECSFDVLINTPPVAENDSTDYAWNDDNVVIDVVLNDFDPDGDPITITDASAVHGDVQISFGNLVYIAPDGWCGTDTVTYVLCDNFNACDTALVVIEVECDYEIFIPEGFSPNGDGVNDTFEIIGLHRYAENRVTVFNRWGRKVFDAANYQNDWDGRSQDALTLGNGILPEGTYFVVLDLPGTGLKPVKGYVYINH